MQWKYGLILVEKDELGEDAQDIYELVELYNFDGEDNWSSFCNARIQSMGELKRAYEDIQKDGPNKWFYENGTFQWKYSNVTMQNHLSWAKKTSINNFACQIGPPSRLSSCHKNQKII